MERRVEKSHFQYLFLLQFNQRSGKVHVNVRTREGCNCLKSP